MFGNITIGATTEEIIKYIIWFILGSGLFIEIVPAFKVNPISFILKGLGKRINIDLFNKLEGLEKNLTAVEKENDMRRIKDLKSEILAFARSLKMFDSQGISDDFTEEDYDRIFEAFKEYEDLLEKYGLENGKTLRAMGTINYHSEKRGFGSAKI